MPRRLGTATVNAGNVTDPDAFGAIVTLRVSTTRPSISSFTGSAVTAAEPRLVRPAVTVTRSSPENAARSNATDVTARFDVSGVATETAVSVAPSGR